MINVTNLSYLVGKKQILHNINVGFESGKLHVLLGPNGSGKSTLLKIIAGQIRPNLGEVHINNKPVQAISSLLLAKQRAFLQQQLHIPFPISVNEVILMGRYPHFSVQPSNADLKIIEEVIQLCNLGSFSNRIYQTLSGGEQQRVQFARVLVQLWDNVEQPKFLLLDEPLNNLDIEYQKSILEIIANLHLRNITTIMVLHDLNWAWQYAQNVLLMKNGQILNQGLANEVLNSQNIEKLFNVQTTFLHNDLGKAAISFH